MTRSLLDRLRAHHRGTEAEHLTPTLVDGLPVCDQEGGCPLYDGKRCIAQGCRPESLCEPAVEALVALALADDSPPPTTTQNPRWRDLSSAERAALPVGTRAQVDADGPHWTLTAMRRWQRFSPSSPNLTDCSALPDEAFVQTPFAPTLGSCDRCGRRLPPGSEDPVSGIILCPDGCDSPPPADATLLASANRMLHERLEQAERERDALRDAAQALLAIYDADPDASDGPEADAAWAELRAALAPTTPTTPETP